MQVKDLRKGHHYYYTAGAEWLDVKYKYETINGYMFTSHDGIDNILTENNVNFHIEEIS